MTKYKFTKEEFQEAIDSNNGSLSDAANFLGIPSNVLYKRSKKMNLSYDNKRSFVNIDPIILQELYNNYQNLRTVGKVLGYSYDRIRSAMNFYGLKYNKPTRYYWNEKFWDNDTESSFYWAGFIAADGCLTGKNNRILSIGLSNKDKSHLEKFKKDIGATHPILDGKNNSVYINIRSGKLEKSLGRFGIVPRKTKVLCFPEWLINHPFVHHFMRGYFDGDGCWSIKNNHKKIKQMGFCLLGTECFLNTFRNILEKNCGLNNKKLYDRGSIKSLDFGGNCIIVKIRDFLYQDANVFLERKYNLVKNIVSNINKPNVKITKQILIDEFKHLGVQNKVAKSFGISPANLNYYIVKFNLHDILVDIKKKKSVRGLTFLS